MTPKQHAVFWLGISLIIIRLFTTEQWHNIYSLITTKVNVIDSQTAQKSTTTTVRSGSQGNGTVRRSHG